MIENGQDINKIARSIKKNIYYQYIMQTFNEMFFAPISREYCNWFYFLTVCAFVFMIIAAIDTISAIVSGNTTVLSGILSFIGPFLLYFSNRLLYSMCSGSLPRHPHGGMSGPMGYSS